MESWKRCRLGTLYSPAARLQCSHGRQRRNQERVIGRNVLIKLKPEWCFCYWTLLVRQQTPCPYSLCDTRMTLAEDPWSTLWSHHQICNFADGGGDCGISEHRSEVLVSLCTDWKMMKRVSSIHHVERSQLRWFVCLIRIPPGRLPSQVFQVHPTSRRLLGDPDHAGGIIHLIWLGKDLGKMLLKMDGPFLNVYRYTQTAKITVGVFVCTCVCLLLLFIQSTYTHTHTNTHSPVRGVSPQTWFSACCWCRGHCKPAHSISQGAAGLAKGRNGTLFSPAWWNMSPCVCVCVCVCVCAPCGRGGGSKMNVYYTMCV